MFKKITTIISSSKGKFLRKATIIGGVVLGIGIGVLMSKDEDDLVIIGEIIPAPGESDYQSSDESDENATDDSDS